MKIAIACDHGALDLKNAVVAHLCKRGFEVVDFGTDSLASCDYPDFVAPAAKAVAAAKKAAQEAAAQETEKPQE